VVDDEIEVLRRRVRELHKEHRDLDNTITGLMKGVYVDELQLRRLKKRKLQLKDTITRLESQLLPDMNA